MIRRLAGFLRGSVDALEERNFRLLWIGQTTSGLGDTLVYVALAFAVLALTGSAIDLGLVLAANALPRVILLLVGGVWADRLPRQLLMVGCDVVRGLLQAALAILPLQLLAYRIARLRDLNVDQPRNLAQTVTVE